MTSTDPTPTLLPGVPMTSWQRAAVVALYVGVPGYLLLGFGLIGPGLTHELANILTTAGLLYFLADAVVLVVIAVFASRRRKRESAAGYTTQWGAEPTLPQLDAKTGALIRSAGGVYVKKKDWRAAPVAGETSATNVQEGPPGKWSGVKSLLVGFVANAVALPAIAGAIAFRTHNTVVAVVVTFFVVVVLFVGIVAIGIALVRGRLTRLHSLAPGDFVFVFAKSKEFGPGLVPLVGDTFDATSFMARGASGDTMGLTIWEGTPYKKRAYLTWSAVTSVQVDAVPGGNSTSNAVLITYKTAGNDLVALPLAYPKFGNFPVPSKADVRWIAAQLNELRGGKSTARGS